jgi:BCCT family betaine/carnitine transporter
LNDESGATKPQSDIGHELGENNVQVLGLDIHNPVFLVSAILAVALVVGTLLFQEQAAVVFFVIGGGVNNRI